LDTIEIKEYENRKNDSSFAYFIQIGKPNKSLENIHDLYNNYLSHYNLELPGELLNDIFTFDDYTTIFLSYGRELEEVSYK
jgi:hypothetical protein